MPVGVQHNGDTNGTILTTFETYTSGAPYKIVWTPLVSACAAAARRGLWQ